MEKTKASQMMREAWDKEIERRKNEKPEPSQEEIETIAESFNGEVV